MKPRFQFIGVSKSYGKVPVFENLDFSIFNNTLTALVGKSGCGKSTIGRILMRLEPYDSGKILYQDSPIASTPLKTFREKNQVLFQDSLLSVNPSFNIQKALIEPLVIKGLRKERIHERILELLEIVEIPASYLSRHVSEVSGGELQRIMLARVLSLSPEFIILDEPFSALDETTANHIGEQFKRIFRQQGIGVLCISPSLRTLSPILDSESRIITIPA